MKVDIDAPNIPAPTFSSSVCLATKPTEVGAMALSYSDCGEENKHDIWFGARQRRLSYATLFKQDIFKCSSSSDHEKKGREAPGMLAKTRQMRAEPGVFTPATTHSSRQWGLVQGGEWQGRVVRSRVGEIDNQSSQPSHVASLFGAINGWPRRRTCS